MSLRLENSDSSWTSVRHTPGAFPSSPTPEPQSNIISAPHSLSQAVKARKEEYIRKKEIRIKVGTWNVGSISGTDKDLGSWFVEGKGVKGLSENLAGLAVESSSTDLTRDTNIESVADQEERRVRKKSTVPRNDVQAVPGGADIDLYVLGLQEVVDISSPTKALTPYTDSDPGKKWKQAMESTLPDGFRKVAEQQLLGLLILVYASPELEPSISSVSATSVGTGLMGYLGNKGAVSVRIVLGELTKLVFVNCHLAAGSDKAALNRRIWDTTQILSRTRFTPITDDGEVTQEFGDSIDDGDFAFWFGDLNYRLDDIPGDDVRRLLLLHTRNEYDVENKSKRKIDSELGYINAPSSEELTKDSLQHSTEDADGLPLDPRSDPASLHTTIQSLLPHDQLRGQQKLGNAFHEGWQEGEINFLPTYKYDVGSVGMFDSGEKKRSPSWCDRILYRTRKQKLDYERRRKDEEDSRKKDADMKARGLDEAASDNAVLFDYDPDEDGLAYGDEYDDEDEGTHDVELLQTRDDSQDAIVLDHYISHQRVLSSDHKPLDAIFTITYDAIIPELKAKVHQEVARELDRAENESRPAVTVVVDNHSDERITVADESVERSGVSCIEFGQLRYGVIKTRGLTIANTGQISAIFSFVDRPAHEGKKGGVAPPWLHLQVDRQSDNANQNEHALKEYTLPPGETTNVLLVVDIADFKLVHRLNTGRIEIDDVLVLRITNGRDYFIPIRGVWLQSCFCRTLDELVRIPDGGIRILQERTPQVLINNESKSSEDLDRLLDQPIRHSAPRELFSLTEAIQDLAERSIAEWDMMHSGDSPPWKRDNVGTSWPFDARTWTLDPGPERSRILALTREALDTSAPFDHYLPIETTSIVRLEIFAETLMLLLNSLRDGIITKDLWSDMETRLNTQEKTKVLMDNEESQAWVMDIMSCAPIHSVSLTFITFMLARMMNELAPVVNNKPNSPRSSRPSTSSNRSEESTADAIVNDPNLGNLPPEKVGFFPSLRRRTGTGNRSSMGSGEALKIPAPERLAIKEAYLDIFASLIIRSERDGYIRSKDKKALETRKKKVLQPFLST